MQQDELAWDFAPQSLIYITGPTQAGKSEFVLRLLQDNARMLGGSPDNPPISLTYLYGIHSPMVHRITQLPLPSVKVFQGLDSQVIDGVETYFSAQVEPDENSPPKLRHILVLDDLAQEASDSVAVTRLLTQGIHHLGITVIFLTHSIFFDAKQRKLQQQQASYFVLFRSPRSMESVIRLGRQISFPSIEGLRYGYQSINALHYTPLVIDLHKDTNPEISILSHIFPEQYPVSVYTA